ncbi:MAG: hypothetical protein ACREBQ_09605, partial [Nitrososphaerales archaeon]
ADRPQSSGPGINLAVGRIYSAPYAFTPPGETIGYDNYNLANFGNGWALDFPWLGNNYLHLTSGQVYPYNWTGSVFQNHNGQDFRLVRNSDKSFDLYLSDGTHYYFTEDKQLSTITDATGNNTITFAYLKGEMSSITDSVGRVVTFANNTAGQITSMKSGGRTWTYSYSGRDLVSVTDPLGRVTGYAYNPGGGIFGNDAHWLLTKITYPTGAISRYTYGSALVGTDATEFYVTLENLNISSTVLSRSSSYNYTIVDGAVTLCNATVSDGTAIRSYDLYNFEIPGISFETLKDGLTGSVIKTTENLFDLYGHAILTDVFGSTGALQYSTSNSYDNWGNVISTIDANGRESWFSYANTNSFDTFTGAGSMFSNSFYANNTLISANIHDALVGEASEQNGPGSQNIETYYDYNLAGELLHEKQLCSDCGAGWIVTSYTYDPYGNALTSTDGLGRTTYFQYSSTYDHAYLTQQSLVVSGQNASTTYAYNFTLGLKSSETDPNGFATYYSYDNLGRPTLVAYP